MTISLAELQAPIAKELEYFEKHFQSALRSKVALLDKIMLYLLKTKGKRIRPMFVFLSAGVCGPIQPATYRAAALIELLHTATLVHDDVVDDADKRRGFFSINALWKNKIAVLIGDYLLSRGLLMALDANDFDLLKIVSEAVRQMSEGELLQLQKARTMNIEEPVYFDIIRQKTASLIASCCACGAASVTQDTELIERMRLFGEKVGIAFQIKDDLLDYSGVNSGKPIGIDIKEKKMTLPLIYALGKSSLSERRLIINVVKNHNQDSQKVKWLIEYVKNQGGINYAEKKMNEFVAQAMELIAPFKHSVAKETLIKLVNFTIHREN
ncbi:MAG: polyprenyl synthetase family protein [Bacteroidia bacterium]|nr:polyprenyl synthetase family protein [Bacteroidia bacterium]MDW8158083.1 polyprenyl synthetase family protein [Bacteroidia bacterium]